MMHRVIISIFIIILSFSVKGQKNNTRLLEKAYKKQSQDMLVQFFQKWSKELPPISKNEFDNLNDTLKSAYLIFQEFYTPNNLNKIGGSEFGEIYKNVNYWLVQNHLELYQTNQVYFTQKEIDSIALANIYSVYEISDADTANINLWKKRYNKQSETMEHWAYEFKDERKDSLLHSIKDFRPLLSSDSNVVYLTYEYQAYLTDFLGEINYQENSESDKKEEFLKAQIIISQGMFKFWHLLTYPSVLRITFDKNFEFAEIKFRILHEGGEAILKKTDNEWILISAKRTWIE